MEIHQNIKDKIFFECKNIIESLSKISNVDELLLKQDSLYEITERIAFLKQLDKNKEFFIREEEVLQFAENQSENINSNNELKEETAIGNQELPKEELEEELVFNNELNEIHADEAPPKERVWAEESREVSMVNEFFETSEFHHIEGINSEKEKISKISETPISEKIPFSENGHTIKSETEEKSEVYENQFDIKENPQNDYHKNIEEKERIFLELEEKRRIVVEIDDIDKNVRRDEKYFEDEKQETLQEKKIKLAHIKGLKSIQSLFDDDPLEKIEEERSEPKVENISLLKSNIPTDFMEKEKPKPEFRLDLNDKISFSKILFGGSQAEMNETINKLNGFKTLDEAKEFLSNEYYARNWQKVDEYAQRLWALVENKFI